MAAQTNEKSEEKIIGTIQCEVKLKCVSSQIAFTLQ